MLYPVDHLGLPGASVQCSHMAPRPSEIDRPWATLHSYYTYLDSTYGPLLHTGMPIYTSWFVQLFNWIYSVYYTYLVHEVKCIQTITSFISFCLVKLNLALSLLALCKLHWPHVTRMHIYVIDMPLQPHNLGVLNLTVESEYFQLMCHIYEYLIIHSLSNEHDPC